MTRTWNVSVHVFDADDIDRQGAVTTAHAVLTTSARTGLDGYGRARRHPGDPAVTEIGEEVAAARALRDLADRLLDVASHDIGAIEHRPVVLRA